MGNPVLSEGLNCFLRDESEASKTLLRIGNVERRRTVGLQRAANTALRSLSAFPCIPSPPCRPDSNCEVIHTV
jgi:hypothetical protein